MPHQIIPFQSSINTCYLIKGEGTIMIDAGYKDLTSSFSKFLHQHEIDPGEIKLIVITHGDFDHVGGASELKQMTGADIAIHDNDRRNMEEGIFHWPEGVTR